MANVTKSEDFGSTKTDLPTSIIFKERATKYDVTLEDESNIRISRLPSNLQHVFSLK